MTMSQERLEAAIPAGEALRYSAECRREGAVGITDERLLLADGEVRSVELDRIDEVTARQVDWFVAILSVALVGVGILAGMDDPLVGVGFVAAGVVSLCVVYRKRGKMTVSVRDRGRPLEFYVYSTDEFLDRLGTKLDEYEARLAAEAGEGPG